MHEWFGGFVSQETQHNETCLCVASALMTGLGLWVWLKLWFMTSKFCPRSQFLDLNYSPLSLVCINLIKYSEICCFFCTFLTINCFFIILLCCRVCVRACVCARTHVCPSVSQLPWESRCHHNTTIATVTVCWCFILTKFLETCTGRFFFFHCFPRTLRKRFV